MFAADFRRKKIWENHQKPYRRSQFSLMIQSPVPSDDKGHFEIEGAVEVGIGCLVGLDSERIIAKTSNAGKSVFSIGVRW